MKNHSFLFVLLLVLSVFSACQKEDLSALANPNAQTVDAGTTDRGGTTTISPTPTGSGSTTVSAWQKWWFCDQAMLVSKQIDPATGLRYLILADANFNPKMKFQGITLSTVPVNVQLAMKVYFSGYTMGPSWISTVQDVTYFLVESVETPGVIVMATKDGTIVCKGVK
jgi:hypothetical protein